jgi:hypothetical protein
MIGEHTPTWGLSLAGVIGGLSMFFALERPVGAVPAGLAALLTGLVVVIFGLALLGRPDDGP